MAWGQLYAHLIACTGWTWEYIDDFMTLPRLREMATYWSDNPPLHFMVAAYFGIGNKKKSSEQDISELQGIMGASLSTELPEWLKTTESK